MRLAAQGARYLTPQLGARIVVEPPPGPPDGLSEEEIDFYASTKEPYDKAGAYAIQGRAALWLDRIEGDYYTIMGLPVSRTVQLVEREV